MVIVSAVLIDKKNVPTHKLMVTTTPKIKDKVKIRISDYNSYTETELTRGAWLNDNNDHTEVDSKDFYDFVNFVNNLEDGDVKELTIKDGFIKNEGIVIGTLGEISKGKTSNAAPIEHYSGKMVFNENEDENSGRYKLVTKFKAEAKALSEARDVADTKKKEHDDRSVVRYPWNDKNMGGKRRKTKSKNKTKRNTRRGSSRRSRIK
uniref:Uncharacterized protein n=1 Tax=viral metagenome TaxID=1070528 RepID=A0A6C0B2J9_9ZZZZ